MTTYEPGQRVTVYTYDGRVIGEGTISGAYKAVSNGFVWVRLTLAGETRTDEYPLTSIRVRS